MKYTPGPLAGKLSGSLGATTASHNRYGPHFRIRVVPTNPNTLAQQNVRARLATFSAAWQTLTAAQQLAWKSWAQENPITNSIGDQQELTGHAAFVQINTRIAQAGDTPIDVPPLTPAPVGLVTLTGSWDIGAGAFELAFAATPLAAGVRLWVRAAVVTSPGVNYVKNLLRVVVISAAAQATGLDTQADIEAVFGTLQVGQTVHVWASAFDGSTGLLSTPLSVKGLVVTT